MTDKQLQKQTAQKIYSAYQMACTANVLAGRAEGNFERVGMASSGITTPLSYADQTARRMFMRAATFCLAIDADPVEYVTAQFARFSELTKYLGKTVLPQPAHIASVGGQVRYLEHKRRKAERADRKALPESEHKKWYREERKLRGLVKMLRVTEEDILADRPEEFSQEFLEHRGVWHLVKDLRSERING